MQDSFNNLVREKRESAEKFHERLNSVAVRAYGHFSEHARRDLVLSQFLSGQPTAIADKLCALNFDDIEAALTAVIKSENYLAKGDRGRARGVRRAEYDDDSANTPTVQQVRETPPVAPQPPTYLPADQSTPNTTDEIGILIAGLDKYQVPPESREWLSTVFAGLESDADGYYDEDLTYAVLRTMAQTRGERPAPPGQKSTCFFCKRPGHRWASCYKLKDILVQNGMRPPTRPNPATKNQPATTTPKTVPTTSSN